VFNRLHGELGFDCIYGAHHLHVDAHVLSLRATRGALQRSDCRVLWAMDNLLA
jgi:hypothetical protein